jgi:hypothetical protein
MNPVITEGSTAIQVMDIITIAFTIAPHIIRVTTTADTTTADTTVTIAIMSIPRMLIKVPLTKTEKWDGTEASPFVANSSPLNTPPPHPARLDTKSFQGVATRVSVDE